MKTAKGKISKKKSGNAKYESYWMYIPSKISKDKSFPFKDKEEVIIELNGGNLIVHKTYSLREITQRYGFSDATLSKLIETRAKDNYNLPFIYFQDQCYSYEDVNNISNRIGNGIIDLCKKLKLDNPKIALLLPNSPDMIFSWIAVAKAGFISVPISYLLKGRMLEYVLKNSESDLIILDFNYLKNFEESSTRLPRIKKALITNAPIGFEFSGSKINFNDILSENSDNPKVIVRNFQPLEISYTSGTTGKPKGVLYRNHFVLSGNGVGKELEKVGIKNPNHKIYCPIPLFQGYSKYFTLIPAMFYNASVIIPEDFNAQNFWNDIIKFKPQGFCYLGAYLSDLMNQKPKTTDRKHSLTYAFGFGASKKIWNSFESRFGIQIIEGWALTEGIGVAINTYGSQGGKLGSVGKPIRGCEIRIIDSDGNNMPPGRNNIGEIITRMRPPFELEYYNLEEKRGMPKLGKNGWIRTGDFGYKDRDGFLYYLGRETDMIRRGDDIFFAVDVESVADSHPAVVKSAAFEVPIKNGSELALKLCVAVKNDSSLTFLEFLDYLKQNLAYFMVPRFIEFKVELPKNANELVQKFILKKEWASKDSRKNTFDTNSGKLVKF